MRSFDIPARQTRDSSDNNGGPDVTDCHLFLPIPLSLSLSSSAADPVAADDTPRAPALSFQIQIREIARRQKRNPTP